MYAKCAVLIFCLGLCTGCDVVVRPTNPKAVVGGRLNVTCILEGTESSCTVKENETLQMFLAGEKLPEESLVIRTSQNSMFVSIPNMTKQHRLGQMVKCEHIGSDGQVLHYHSELAQVEYEPVFPEMECISYNNKDMTCTWTFPYEYWVLSFSVNYTNIASFKFKNCSLHAGYQEIDAGGRLTVNGVSAWQVSFPQERGSVPRFNKRHDYCFYVTASNSFGEERSRFYHVTTDSSIVKPDPVRFLTTPDGETPMSRNITLTWSPPSGIDGVLAAAKGMMFQVLYSSQWDSTDETIEIERPTLRHGSETVELTIPDLIPHTEYKFSVRCKLLSDENHYWSEWSYITNSTASAVPLQAPVIPPGSFSCTGPRDDPCSEVIIYWQAMAKRDQYGTFKSYSIVHNGNRVEIFRRDLYKHFKLKTSYNRFELYLDNDAGPSKTPSVLTIDTTRALPKSPFNFGAKPVDGKKLHLYWTPPQDVRPEGYMIYQCESSQSDFCESSIQYLHVSSDTEEMQVDFTTRVGIATITRTQHGTSAYSGINWVSCTFPETDGVAESPDKLFGSGKSYNSLSVSWAPLNCHRSKSWVKYYSLTYWDTLHCKSASCQRSVNITYWDTEVTASLPGLHPNTMYTLSAKAVTVLGDGMAQAINLTTDAIVLEIDYDKHPTSGYQKVNISWSKYAVQPQAVQAIKHLDNGQESVVICSANKKMSYCSANFNCTGYTFKKIVDVTFTLLGDDNRPLSTGEKRGMCIPVALSAGAIAGIAIGCSLGLILFVLVGVLLYRQGRKEIVTTRETTKIIVPGSLSNGNVSTKPHNDYSRRHSSSPSDNEDSSLTKQKMNNNKAKDSGVGTISTSSTAPLIREYSMTDDVFEEEKHRMRQHHYSGPQGDAMPAGYMDPKQLQRSESYVDNEDIDMTVLSCDPVNSAARSEYSKFGMVDLEVNDDSGPKALITLNQAVGVMISPNKVQPAPKAVLMNGIPTPNLDFHVNMDTLDADALNVLSQKPQLTEVSDDYVYKPPEEGSAGSVNYVKYAENGDDNDESSIQINESNQPITVDTTGYLGHDMFPAVNTDNYPDSGMEGSSGESIPKPMLLSKNVAAVAAPGRKRDSGYMSPESGTFNFMNSRGDSGSSRLGSGSSSSSAEVQSQKPPAVTDYVTVPPPVAMISNGGQHHAA